MIVIDASVAVKWVTEEDDSDAAARLLTQDLGAPDLWRCEAANALWAKQQRGLIDREHARAAVGALLDAPVVVQASGALLPAAFAMAVDLDHPVYDCLYLAAAEFNDTKLVTADRRFFERCANHPYLVGPA